MQSSALRSSRRRKRVLPLEWRALGERERGVWRGNVLLLAGDGGFKPGVLLDLPA